MPMNEEIKYKRVLLKLSGELFGKNNGWGISFPDYRKIAKSIIKIKERNHVELTIVVGGGNIFRGRSVKESYVDEAVADTIGMLGTIINGMALQDALESLGAPTRMMSAIKMSSIAEPFIRRRAIRHLEKGRIVIFAGGTGNPFFTTDSAAALRACEIRCDAILKATNVDGVYDKDPKKHKDAKMLKKVTYKQALNKNLQVMDNTAFALCWKNQVPIIVFNVKDIPKIPQIVRGEKIGTLVN